jgi:hypothetical protein
MCATLGRKGDYAMKTAKLAHSSEHGLYKIALVLDEHKPWCRAVSCCFNRSVNLAAKASLIQLALNLASYRWIRCYEMDHSLGHSTSC